MHTDITKAPIVARSIPECGHVEIYLHGKHLGWFKTTDAFTAAYAAFVINWVVEYHLPDLEPNCIGFTQGYESVMRWGDSRLPTFNAMGIDYAQKAAYLLNNAIALAYEKANAD